MRVSSWLSVGKRKAMKAQQYPIGTLEPRINVSAFAGKSRVLKTFF